MSDPRHHYQLRDNHGTSIQGDRVSVTFMEPKPPAPPHQAPNADRKYTNRVDELARLESVAAQVLRERRGALALLTGERGVGKSVTLAEVAHRVGRGFEAGDLYFDLRDWRNGEGVLDVAAVLRRMLAQLQVGDVGEETDVSVLHGRLRRTTTGEPLLLLLDGVADERDLRALSLGTGPHLVVAACAFGFTSTAELVAAGAEAVTLTALGGDDSLALLRSFHGVDRRLRDRDEWAAAQRLVELCGGLPAALRMAAGHIEAQELGVAELVNAIRERQRSTFPPRSGAEVVVDLAVSGLAPDRRRVLDVLATDPGRGFDRELAHLVLGERADEVLNGLAEAGLLHRGEGGGRGMVELVRKRVREEAGDNRASDAAAVLRYHTVTHHLADRAALGERHRLTDDLPTAELTVPPGDHMVPFDGRREAAEWQDRQIERVPELMSLALELDRPLAVPALADAVWPTCYGRRRLKTGVRIYQRALEVARWLDHHGAVARCANYLARVYIELDMTERALALVAEAEREADRTDHELDRAVILETQALLKERHPDLPGSPEASPRELLTRCRRIHREAGRPRGEAMQTYQLGGQALRRGDLTDALQELTHAENIADRRIAELERESPDRWARWIVDDWKQLRARIRLLLARVLAGIDRTDEAARKAEAALEVFVQVADPVKQVRGARLLAELDRARGEHDLSRKRLEWAGKVAGHYHLETESAQIRRELYR